MTRLIKYLLCIVAIYFCQLTLLAQQNKIDSLLTLLKTDKDDTNKVIHFNYLASKYRSIGELDKTLQYGSSGLELSKKINYDKGTSDSYSTIGIVYQNKGNYEKALENYIFSLRIKEKIGDKKGLSGVYNNIGSLYKDRKNYDKALENYFNSIKIKTELGDIKGLAGTYNNTGLVFWAQKNYDKALDFFFKSIKIIEEFNLKSIHANVLGNIGIIYEEKADLVQKTDIRKYEGYRKKAFEYYFKALKISDEIGDVFQSAINLGNIGSLYANQNNYNEAEKYLVKALKMAEEIGALDLQKEQLGNLSELYFGIGEYKTAYKYHKQYSDVNDSLFNEESGNQIAEMAAKYETDKKEQQIKLIKSEQEKERTITDAAKKRQLIILFCVVGVLVLVFIFAGFITRTLRITRKQKSLIEKQKVMVEHQKMLVEVHHKEITDSINYAERIQRSFLATKELLDENLTSTGSANRDYFVLFKPKDVVSGDFYWATSTGPASNRKFILVTADSTGHGVPGAIMSLLNITSLESAIKDGFTEPSDILNATRKTIIERLKKDGSADGGKDGMDASLICFDFINYKLVYSAANNPVWIVRKKELIELKPDKMPIGKNDKDTVPFTQHEFDLQKDDMVYALTDGLPDQFGGPKGKKFLYKQLKELLISISSKQLEVQNQIIADALNNWKGNLEQVDDVCVIGVRI